MLLSVIIPVHNGEKTLPRCLESLGRSSYANYECVVVDDGSTDGSAKLAEEAGVRVVSVQGPSGPAYARNEGAQTARGEILVFLDADVAVHPDTLARFAAAFEQDSATDAVIGSYDDSPADAGLISSFKNLMHHYIHQHGKRAASSFWCGCGAVKREVFLGHGGLDESYTRPSIEDIEFGLRLFQAGHKTSLDPRIQAKHLKVWTLGNLVKTDVLARGVPWTALILRTGFLPDDLNLRWMQRISIALSGLLAAMLLVSGFYSGGALLAMAGGCIAVLGAIIALNSDFYGFLATRRGWRFSFAAVPLHLLYFFYSGVSFVAGTAAYFVTAILPTAVIPTRGIRPVDDTSLECDRTHAPVVTSWPALRRLSTISTNRDRRSGLPNKR